MFLASCDSGQESHDLTIDNNQKQHLKQLFIDWWNNEVAKGHLWASDSCYPGWIADNGFDGMIEDMWGIPDSSEYNFSYADINGDGQFDQLVTFTPSQCDGGNASMWIQIAVLTISKNGKYITTASIGDGIFSAVGKDRTGFYWYDSIGVNKIYGTFYNFMDNDGHCCPGIEKPVIIAYDTKEVIFIGDNIQRK
jgi:hypothetical protein